MSFKQTNHFKFASVVCLSVLVLFIIPYGYYQEDRRVPAQPETMSNDSVIHQVKVTASLRDSIVSFGMELLGVPYVAGACSKEGFDCSGFVYYVFRHFNIQVPRSSSQFKNFGKEIPIDSVSKGDILVFLSPSANVIGHVGIAVIPKGKETVFIHASSGRPMKVIMTNLKQEGYKRRFVKVIDVL
jgi:cell wall-associated NlpC family hydrolase